jgi:predicted permease
MGLSALIHLMMVGFVVLVFRNKKGEKAEVENAKMRCMRAGSVFGNIGYMGIPFIKMLFSNSNMLGEILIYVAVGITVFNILNWSFGIYLVTGEKKYISFKKAFINPTGISIIIGLVIFLIARKPIVELAVEGSVIDQILSAIMNAANVVADMITPLAMTVIGIRLANMKMKDLFTEKWVYVTSLNKLVIMSVLTMFIIWLIPISPAIEASLFFAASMPAATSTVLFAVNFGGDSKTAASIVVQTVLLSIITIPLMFLLLTGVFGVTF